MATRINGGVRLIEDGIPILTKQRLKDIVKSGHTHLIEFYPTASIGPDRAFSGPISLVPEGIMLDIVGPDPYNKRSWYASIALDAKGCPRVVN